MAEQSQEHAKQLQAFLNALEESVWRTSDQAILEECLEEGTDPKLVARRVRNVLKDAVKRHKQNKLLEAQQRYRSALAALQHCEQSVPTSSHILRDLLLSFFAIRPEFRTQILTAQCRDFRDLTDADILSLVKQLAILGALNILPSGDHKQT